MKKLLTFTILLLFLPCLSYAGSIRGSIKKGGSFIEAGVKVVFIDKNNKKYPTVTKKNGQYRVYLKRSTRGKLTCRVTYKGNVYVYKNIRAPKGHKTKRYDFKLVKRGNKYILQRN